MRRALTALFVREMRIAGRIGGGSAVGVVFFLILVTVVPFGVGPDLPLLARIGPALLWIAALLATLLGLDRLFQADHDDGSLDAMLGADLPAELTVAVKCLAHWVTTGLPLVVAAPLFGLMLWHGGLGGARSRLSRLRSDARRRGGAGEKRAARVANRRAARVGCGGDMCRAWLRGGGHRCRPGWAPASGDQG